MSSSFNNETQCSKCSDTYSERWIKREVDKRVLTILTYDTVDFTRVELDMALKKYIILLASLFKIA